MGLPTVSFDDFTKLDIRVGKVIEVDLVPQAKKLIRMKIDIGGEARQTVAGLGTQYRPEDLKEKEVVVVTNLAPRKIFGIESQVMLLAAVEGELVSLLSPDKKVSAGAKVG